MTAVQSGELQARIRALLPYFYSPFDFGGMVTRPPRVHRRFRRRLRLLRIPADLTGKTVLDIGAYDGFFSFEFERRGAARVLAIDTRRVSTASSRRATISKARWNTGAST